TEELNCVKRGLYFLRREDQPFLIAVSPPRRYAMGEEPILELIARDQAAGHATLSALLTEAQRNNIYKGKAISLERPRSWRDEISIRFHDLRPTDRSSIVLPEAVLQVIERNVLSLLQHRETMRKAGRSTRQGLLFHGSPGTGKTLVLRYLARACE